MQLRCLSLIHGSDASGARWRTGTANILRVTQALYQLSQPPGRESVIPRLLLLPLRFVPRRQINFNRPTLIDRLEHVAGSDTAQLHIGTRERRE